MNTRIVGGVGYAISYFTTGAAIPAVSTLGTTAEKGYNFAVQFFPVGAGVSFIVSYGIFCLALPKLFMVSAGFLRYFRV
jgi:hypothetical protein